MQKIKDIYTSLGYFIHFGCKNYSYSKMDENDFITVEDVVDMGGKQPPEEIVMYDEKIEKLVTIKKSSIQKYEQHYNEALTKLFCKFEELVKKTINN